MSRRASLFAKQNPGKPRPKVRFPDELVFLDNIKENDISALDGMLRRASLQVDISGINDAGKAQKDVKWMKQRMQTKGSTVESLTPLHQAVLDGNIMAVRLLIQHGADINRQDEDSWTPLHAACAEGRAGIAKLLLKHGANKEILTEEGERPLDLVEPTDFATIKVMLGKVPCEGDTDSADDLDDDTHDQT